MSSDPALPARRHQGAAEPGMEPRGPAWLQGDPGEGRSEPRCGLCCIERRCLRLFPGFWGTSGDPIFPPGCLRVFFSHKAFLTPKGCWSIPGVGAGKQAWGQPRSELIQEEGGAVSRKMTQSFASSKLMPLDQDLAPVPICRESNRS